MWDVTRATCERCGLPKARDIQDAVDNHFGPDICCDVQGSPAGQLGCRDRTIQQLKALLRRIPIIRFNESRNTGDDPDPWTCIGCGTTGSNACLSACWVRELERFTHD